MSKYQIKVYVEDYSTILVMPKMIATRLVAQCPNLYLQVVVDNEEETVLSTRDLIEVSTMEDIVGKFFNPDVVSVVYPIHNGEH